MARGPSGRLVLEVDPDLKRQLHAQVALEGKTFKDWFLEVADAYLASAEEEQTCCGRIHRGLRPRLRS